MIFRWVLTGLLSLEAIGYILGIGRHRDPITHGMAACEVILAAVLICGVFNWL